MPRPLEQEDVRSLLRKEVKKAGGQASWSRKNGANRTIVNQVLRGRMQPTRAIVNALGLRIVYVVRGTE
jgi:DNA-binding phage protein